MSRRGERARKRPPEDERAAVESGRPAPGRRPPRIAFLPQVAILVAVFAIGSLIAEAAGAANLGVALGVGQICFAIALVAVIVKT